MKPGWDIAPAWAMWLACNHSGRWNWFENKPTARLEWKFWTADTGLVEIAEEPRKEEEPCGDWTRSREARPGTKNTNKTSTKYNIGDWVEVEYKEDIHHCKVNKVTDDTISIDFDGMYRTVPTDGSVNRVGIKLIRKILPHDVVLDFGSGIEGTIKQEHRLAIQVWDISGKWFTNVPIAMITEPMKSTVLELLKAQSEEEK